MTNNDQKRIRIAMRVSQSSTTLIQALNDLIDVGQQMAQSGLNFTGADFSGTPELQHLDSETITACLTSAEATKDWLATSFNATNFQKARLQ